MANAAPPLSVEAQEPVVLTVAVAVVLDSAVKLTAGAGDAVHDASFRTVVTGLSLADGLTAVPTAELGAVTLLIVSCATLSAPLLLIALELAAT